MGQMLKTWMKWKHNFLVGFLPTTTTNSSFRHCTFRTISIVLCVFPLLFVQLVTVQGIQISSSTTSSIAQTNAAKVLKQILNVQFDKQSEENLNLVRDDGKERFLWRVSSLNNDDKNVKGDTSNTTPNSSNNGRVESSSPGEEMGPLRIFKYVTGDEDNHRNRQGGGRSISMQQMKSSSENKRSNGAVNASGKIKSNGASVTSSVHTDPKAASASVTDRSLIRNSYFEAPTNKKKNEPQSNSASESPMPVNKMNHSITYSSNKSSNSKSSVVHVQYNYNNNNNNNNHTNNYNYDNKYDNNVGIKVNVKDIQSIQEKVTPKSEVLINGTISERPRRSPFHRYPPLKMVAVGPNSRQGPRAHLYHRGGHPNHPNRHVPVPMHKMRPPPPHQQQQQKFPQLPVPVPYTSNLNNEYMSHGSDFFGGNNFNDPSGNQQDSTFNNFMFSKPRTFQRPQQSNNPRNRNTPAGRRGRPTNNVSQGVPLPRPMRHPSRNRSKRPRPSKTSSPYQYPKNAENIQDILSFFDKENEVDGPGPRGKGPPGLGHGQGQGQGPPGGPMDRPTSSDFSKELRDVQSSLLKDIREFAKRPSMMSHELPITPNQHQQHSPSPSSSSSISSSPFNSIMHDDQDAMEELFDPKPKPVRDMVKSGSRNRDRDREDERERRDREREREREREYQRQLASKNSQKSRMRYQPPVIHDEESKERYREERPRNRPNRHQHTSTESSRYNRDRSKENNYNRESNTKSRNKYKEDPFSFEDHDRYRDFPTRDFPNRDFPSNYRDRESDEYRQKGPSKSPYRSTNKPVVLKRPFESSMMDMEFPTKQKRPTDFDNFYTPFGGGNSPENYRIKPSGSHSVAKASSLIPGYNAHFGGLTFRPYIKPASPEIEEDIVEIHTGPHTRHNHHGQHHHAHHNVAPNYHEIIAEREREKQMNMQKLYMDFLQQKMQAEAQATLVNHAPPTSPPKKTKPMRMKIHIYPNEGSSGSESTITPNVVHPNNPALHTSNFAIANNPNFHVGGFSASNPNVMSIQPRDKNVQMYSFSTNPNTHRTLMLPGPGPAPPIQPNYGMSENHNINLNHHNSHTNNNNNNNNNQGSAGMGVDKNKNVVLHLHVHRRNGGGSGAPLELEAEASELHPVSVKPLSYKDIYDEREDRDNREDQRQQQQQQENDQEHDKSVSMEVPIHDDKIDDVLQTLLKLRDKQEATKEEN